VHVKYNASSRILIEYKTEHSKLPLCLYATMVTA